MATLTPNKLRPNKLVVQNKLQPTAPAVRKDQSLARLNDPYQINTVLDVLFNNAALKANYGNASLGSRLKAVRDMTYNQYIKPLFKGQFKVVGLNTLTSLGETFDVFGNIVKSVFAPHIDKTANIDYDQALYMVEAVRNKQAYISERTNGPTTYLVYRNGKAYGFDANKLKQYESIVNSGRTVDIGKLTLSERVKSSIGYGDYGRINYDTNLGAGFISDMLVEVLLDPETWVLLGKSALSQIASGSVDDMFKYASKQIDDVVQATAPVEARSAAREAAAKLINEESREQLSRQVLHVFRKGKVTIPKDQTYMNQMFKQYLGKAVKQGTIFNEYNVKSIRAAVHYVLLSQNMPMEALTDPVVRAAIQRGLSKHVNRMTMNVLKGTDALSNSLDEIQKWLCRASLSPVGTVSTIHLAHKSLKIAKTVNHTIESADQMYSNSYGNRKLSTFFDGKQAEKRVTQTVTDGLPTDLKALYKEPEYLRKFEVQAAHDVAVIESWYKHISESALGKQCTAIRAYIFKAQESSVEDTLHMLNKIIKSTDQSSFVLYEYKNMLENLVDDLHYFERRIADNAHIMAVREVTDALLNTSDISPVYKYCDALSNNINELFNNSKIGFTIRDFEKTITEVSEDSLERVRIILERVKNLGGRYEACADDTYKAFVDLHNDSVADLLEIFDKLSLGYGAISVKRQAEFMQTFVKYLEIRSRGFMQISNNFNRRVTDMLDDIDSAWYFAGRPASVVDGITQAQTAFNTKFKKLMKRMNYRSGKGADTGADKAVDVEKLPINSIPNRSPEEVEELCEQVLDMVETLSNQGRYDSLGIFAKAADEFDLAVAPENLVKYSYDTFEMKMLELLHTPTSSLTYVSLYNEVTNLLSNLVTSMQRKLELYDMSQIRTIQDYLDVLQNYCRPDKADIVHQIVESYESTFVIKQEAFTSLINTINDPDVCKLIDELSAGPVNNLLEDIKRSPIYSDELREVAQTVQDSVSAFESTRNFVYRTLLADIEPDTRQALFSSVMKYYWLSPESFKQNIEYWTNRIVDDIDNYTQFTKQASRKHNLNELMKDNQFVEFVQSAYRSCGEEMPKTELHRALSDAVASYGVLDGLASADNDLGRKLRNKLQGKVVINVDCEAMNTAVNAGANNLHQCAYVILKDGKTLDKFSQSVGENFIRGKSGYDRLPEHSYLYQLMDMTFRKSDGTYIPELDYTKVSSETLAKFYIDHIQQGNTLGAARIQQEVLLNMFQGMYRTLEKAGAINPETGEISAVIVGHNIKGFDLPFWKSLCREFDLYEFAAKEPRYGFDLRFLDKLEVLDTFELTKKADDLYMLKGKEENIVRKLLFQYADELGDNDTAKLFTAYTTRDLYRVKKLINELRDNTNMGKHLPELNDLAAQVAKARETLTDIFKNNRTLADNYYTSSLIRDPANRKYWLKVLHNELGMSEEEIVKRFGRNAKNIQLSSFFAAAGDYQTFAYKWELKPELMDAWFIETFTRTKAGNLTRNEIRRCNKVAHALEIYKKEVKNFDLYSDHYHDFHTAVETILHTGDFAYLRYLRTDGLNVAEQWAVYKYVSKKVPDEELLPLLKSVMSEQAAKDLITLKNVSRNFSAVAQDKHIRAMLGDETEKTLAYKAMLEDVMNLRQTFETLSNYADDKDLVGNAVTIHIKAMEPILNVLDELCTNLGKLDGLGRVEFHNIERDFTNQLSLRLTRNFIDTSAEDMLRWLTYSKGHAVIDMYAFKSMDDYGQFISKLKGPEFEALNIHYAEDGAHLWVYLTKDAQLNVRKNFKTDTKLFMANGKIIEPLEHEKFTKELFEEVYSPYIDPSMLDEAMEALDFMTDGACRGTTYEMYSKNVFEKMYDQMPEAMRKEFYDTEDLSGPLFWDASPYNYSILGSTTNKRQFGIGTSGQLISSLRNATEYRMNEHGSKLVYLQAMFSKSNALQNTKVGEAIVEDSRAAAKWFKENPDYTAAILVPSKINKQGFRLIECPMDTVDGVRKALKANARVVSYSEFEKLYEVINTNMYSETAASGWQSILRIYKIGYLFHPGTWARNGIDAFIKNTQSTGSGMVASYTQAFKDLKDYDRIVKDLNDLGHGHRPTVGAIEKFFDGKKKIMSYEKFKKLDAFFSDPSAGSEAKLYTKLNAASRKKYLEQLKEAGQITTDEFVKQKTRQSFNSFTNFLLSPMNYVERVSRLAEYQQLTRQGHNSLSAMRLVEQTHFAYSTKSPVEQTLELLIPFYTFASRNLVYWLDALENNPAYFSVLRDVLEPAINLDQYSPEELEENNSLQRNVFAGNIPLIDNYYWSTNFSFMDSLEILTNPLEQAKSMVFSPVQSIINVWLQCESDEAYNEGRAVLSNWMQETFGLKMTKQQVQEKYGDWAAEYERLYGYKISSQNPFEEWLTKRNILQLIPLIGSQVQRAETTGVYLDDGDELKAILYALGLAVKANRWDNIQSDTTKQLNSELYELYQSEDTRNRALQIARTLGYEHVSIKQLPNDVKSVIIDLMNGKTPTANVIPVITDYSAMRFIWNELKQKHDVSGTPFERIPKETLNEMYEEVAESTVHLANIYDLLKNDEQSRISYSILKKNLGLGSLKVYQLPLDSLGTIEHAMRNHVYVKSNRGSFPRPTRNFTHYNYSNRRSYNKPAAKQTFYSGAALYNTRKGVYPNYGHAYAQRSRKEYTNFYNDLYTKTGRSRMELAMLPVKPEYLKYRIKDYYYYLK